MSLESAIISEDWTLPGRTRASLKFAAAKGLCYRERNRWLFSDHYNNGGTLDALSLVALRVILAGNLVLNARLHGLASEKIVLCLLYIIIKLLTRLLERRIMR